MIYEDAIPLSFFLSEYLTENIAISGPEMNFRTLESYEAVHVVPFLKKNLGWRVTDTTSNPINNEQQIIDSGLEILASLRDFDIPTQDDPLGLYYTATAYPDITEDKVGGYGYQASPA